VFETPPKKVLEAPLRPFFPLFYTPPTPTPPTPHTHNMDFMGNMPSCRRYSSAFYDALQELVEALPAKGEHSAFRVNVGRGHEVSVSILPDANPGPFEVVETRVFGPDGQAIYDLPEEFEYGGDVRRFYTSEGGEDKKVAAHIKALREHFGYNAAGGAAAAPPNSESDQDSDQDQEVVSEAIVKKIQEIICKQLETLRKLLRVDYREDIQELIGERLRAARRHRAEIAAEATRQRAEIAAEATRQRAGIADEITALKTQLGALRAEMMPHLDNMRTMAERMRGLEELVHAQQEQMRLMSESMALSFAFINKKLTTASK